METEQEKRQEERDKRVCANCGEKEKYHYLNSYPCKHFKLKKEVLKE